MLGLLLHRVVKLFGAQDRPHARNQRSLVHRLGQVFIATDFQAGHDVLSVGTCSNQDDRDEGNRRVGLQPTADFEPVHLRHHDVEKDEVGQSIAGASQRLLSIGCHQQVVAVCFQPPRKDIAICLVVVGDEYQRRIAHRQVSLVRNSRTLARS